MGDNDLLWAHCLQDFEAEKSFALRLSASSSSLFFRCKQITKLGKVLNIHIYFLLIYIMASSVFLHNMCCISPYSPNCYRKQTLALTHSQFLHSNSLLKLKKQSLLSDTQTRDLKTHKPRSFTVVYAAQSSFLKG